jgi:hypothetical protein
MGTDAGIVPSSPRIPIYRPGRRATVCYGDL